MSRNFFRVLLVLWAGSLWSLALWVAPTLFYAQPDRHLAGVLAGRLFAVETYVGLGVAVLALVLPGRTQFVAVYVAALLLALNTGLITHAMNLAHVQGSFAGLTFGAWHGVSGLIYVGACLLMLVAVWKRSVWARPARRHGLSPG